MTFYLFIVKFLFAPKHPFPNMICLEFCFGMNLKNDRISLHYKKYIVKSYKNRNVSVRPSVCLLDLVGQVQGSVSLTPNNYFDVFAVTHVKHKEIFFDGKCCSSCTSTDIVCNKWCILFR